MLFKMNFEEWLTVEMEKRVWSQSDLARHSGLSQAQVSRVANGLRPPGNDFCKAVAKAFKLPEEIVMRKAGILDPETDLKEKEEELLYLFRKLPDTEKVEAIRYIRIRFSMLGKDD